MPVFKVSEAFGISIASASGIRAVPTSHQEGHIAAGVWSSGLKSKEFLALHLSGGTTELLWVQDHNGSYDIEIVGGTQDISAGQFVDRIGVAMGMPFPAGSFLEKKAQELQGEHLAIPLAIKGTWFSFSGPATFTERAFAQGFLIPSIARGVEVAIAHSLIAAVKAVIKNIFVRDLLVVGGLAANNFIRQELTANLRNLQVFFPARAYAGDNAVGIAYIAALRS